MAICPRCKHENREGELICSSCGYALVAPLATKQLDSASALRLSLPATGDTRLLDKMLIRLELAGKKRIDIAFKPTNDELILGRFVPGTDGKPDVDLTDNDGLALGVSRFHAALKRVGQNVAIVDTHSANGTWVNGKRLASNDPLFLHDGDEIFLGDLKLMVFFVR